MSDECIFGNIAVGARGAAAQGSLKINKEGFTWRKTGGERTVEIPASDVTGMIWSPVHKGFMLAVERNESATVSFLGFKENDLDTIRSIGLADIKSTVIQSNGHNWGSISIDGASLTFKVDGKPTFIVPLPDVAQAQQGRDDVMLQFPVDDTTGGDREDQLMEIAFHIPKDCSDFPAPAAADDTAPLPASKVFFDIINEYTDAGASTGDAIFTFDSIAIMVPRGRFDVEMFSHSLKLVGQAQDYRVQYSSILRIFILPKISTPQTLVAIVLDPPIRKGQTYYNTILCQFHNDEEVTAELDISDESLAAKNEKGAKLERTMSGNSPDIFARVLRGLSGAKLTRPGTFRDATGEAFAVRCSYKADDGYLYPLERAFFYVQKPPMLMTYDDVDAVEFLRPAAGVTASKTFDLSIRLKNGQDHTFRGIPRSEWTNLFEWIQAKNLRIENFKEAQRGPGATMVSYAEDMVPIDAGLATLGAKGELSSDSGRGSDDEEDEDFAASSSSDESSSSEDEEEGGDGSAKKKKEKSEKPPKKKKAKKDPAADGEGATAKTRKPRKKKDKDAPKKPMSAFMLYSNSVRDQVKADNPGIAFGEVGKKIGEMWKALTAEDKAPFDAKAVEAKERYAEEIKAYHAKKAAEGGDAEMEDAEEAPAEEAPAPAADAAADDADAE